VTIEFGVFDHLDNDHLPMSQYYEERLKVIELYDKFGFHAWHVAEHHATPLGMAPSPNVFLAAVAQRTKQLHFGPMVYALPLYHPLRLAQEICMIDQMSNGRLEIGFGRGSSPTEISYFGVDANNTEAIFRDYLPRILGAIETGVMHCPDQPEKYRDVVLKVSSVQRPYPRVWYGVHTTESADRAARRGWHTVNLDMDYEARECNETFRRVWREAQPGKQLPLMGLGRFVVVADTDAEALAIARRAYPHWHAGFTHLFRILGRMQRHPRPDTWDKLHEQGKGVAGSPATVAAFLKKQLTHSQCNYCVGQFAFGDQSLAELTKSVTLFSQKVMPELRGLDVIGDA
jgi:alkanesulfonate monooxygenase SsuD/methylene tetrahydromethanopterin reductase-like flavin-dependent oxidoreductase (luciferase family)